MKSYKIILRMVCLCFILLGFRINVFAAFPSDLDERHMTAHALTDTVTVYSDSSMKKEIVTINGDDFLFTATDVTDDQKALYGVYKKESTGEKGKGWVSSSAFLYDDTFKHVYATVRASMTIYESSSLSSVRTSIKKYSGIIAVGKAGDAVQVIYETKKGYGIGWMSVDEYSNRLDYDGRDKQTLADGTYRFQTLNQISATTETETATTATTETETATTATTQTAATETTTAVTETAGNQSTNYKLEYVSKKMYHLIDSDTKQYVTITSTPVVEEEVEKNPSWLETGWRHMLKKMFSADYRKKLENWEKEKKEQAEALAEKQAKIASGEIYEDTEKQVDYALTTTADKNDASLFYVKRHGNYFSVSWGKSSIYCGKSVGTDGNLVNILTKIDSKLLDGKNAATYGDYLWKVRATKPLVKTKNPMVITQYDPEWCGNDYGGDGCIGTAGCGLLATVNAVYSLTGQYMSVMELADYAVETGLRILGSGTDDGIFKAAADKYGDKYGFAFDGKSGSIATLKKKLQKGDVATVHVIGHYVAVVAYDAKKDKYLLLDSNCLPKREDTAFGDWISPYRLLDGYLYGQMYFFYKLAD